MDERPKDSHFEELMGQERGTVEYQSAFSAAVADAILDARKAKEGVENFSLEEVTEVLDLPDRDAIEKYCGEHNISIDLNAITASFETKYPETMVRQQEATERFLKKLNEKDPRNKKE